MSAAPVAQPAGSVDLRVVRAARPPDEVIAVTSTRHRPGIHFGHS
jgi:hypothetical protein